MGNLKRGEGGFLFRTALDPTFPGGGTRLLAPKRCSVCNPSSSIPAGGGAPHGWLRWKGLMAGLVCTGMRGRQGCGAAPLASDRGGCYPPGPREEATSQPWAGNWLCRDAATLSTRATSGGRGKKGRGFCPSSPAKPTRSRGATSAGLSPGAEWEGSAGSESLFVPLPSLAGSGQLFLSRELTAVTHPQVILSPRQAACPPSKTG